MENTDHIVACGNAAVPHQARPDQILRLNLGGNEANVDLEIVDIRRRLSSDVPDVLVDLAEIASYVYCADQAVSRGGEGVTAYGGRWRRRFSFHVPVRLPSFWRRQNVCEALQKTLSLLSEDTYEFRFTRGVDAVPMQHYLRFGESDSAEQEIDEVMLFSGGVDSLAGSIQEAVLAKHRVALVSHRSNPKISKRQKQLVEGLHAVCGQQRPLHVPVWVHQRGSRAREYTQRTPIRLSRSYRGPRVWLEAI